MIKINILKKCECEHAAHFKDTMPRAPLTPNGNAGHKYNASYYETYLVMVKTPFGTFRICKDCADDCYSEWKKD